MDEKSNQNAVTKITLNQLIRNAKILSRIVKKPDSCCTKRLDKLELELEWELEIELNLLCHIWFQFQRLIPQTSRDAWGEGVESPGETCSYFGAGVAWVRGLGLATCRWNQTSYEFLANYFIYLHFRIAQIIITNSFIQIALLPLILSISWGNKNTW